MALVALCVVLLLLGGHLEASLGSRFGFFSESKRPDCTKYRLPACPRNLNPVCGSDMITYPNECILCLKIWEQGYDIKIIHHGPC